MKSYSTAYAGTKQHRVLETWKRMHEVRLHIPRQAHREAVDIDLRRVEPFGFEENLMPFLVREPDDLVLERRAVARPDAANLSVEQRRAVEVRAHQVADAIVGVQQMAVNLWATDPICQERERDRLIVAALEREDAPGHLRIEVDAPPIEPRRGAGLQPPVLEADRLERLRKLAGRRFAGAPRRMLLGADVNEPVQKRAGRDHQRRAAVGVAIFHREAGDSPMLHEHAAGLAEAASSIFGSASSARRTHAP